MCLSNSSIYLDNVVHDLLCTMYSSSFKHWHTMPHEHVPVLTSHTLTHYAKLTRSSPYQPYIDRYLSQSTKWPCLFVLLRLIPSIYIVTVSHIWHSLLRTWMESWVQLSPCATFFPVSRVIATLQTKNYNHFTNGIMLLEVIDKLSMQAF